jgi:hypothetical protein
MSGLRIAVVAAVALGAAGGLALFLSFRDPCGALLRRYAAAYERSRACRADADCALDAMPAGGPGLCDRARAEGAGRGALAEIEAEWLARGCPAPGSACPPPAGVRCQAGRCATVLR